MASDRNLISTEDHELNYVLRKWEKRQTKENREKLIVALRAFKKDPGYKPANRTSFYKYADDKMLKKDLE